MSEHNPDTKSTLDEIEGAAAVVARFWLRESERAICDLRIAPSCEVAAMKGFMQAAAINYAAERQVDAAMRVADGLQAIAAAIRESKEAQS